MEAVRWCVGRPGVGGGCGGPPEEGAGACFQLPDEEENPQGSGMSFNTLVGYLEFLST